MLNYQRMCRFVGRLSIKRLSHVMLLDISGPVGQRPIWV